MYQWQIEDGLNESIISDNHFFFLYRVLNLTVYTEYFFSVSPQINILQFITGTSAGLLNLLFRIFGSFFAMIDKKIGQVRVGLTQERFRTIIYTF